MIQRIQSLYLLVSTILGVVCLSLSLGRFSTEQGEHIADLFNLWVKTTETGEYSFSPWALFALLLVATTLTFLAIFLYKSRALQMRTLSLCIVLLIGYYSYFVFFVLMSRGETNFIPSPIAALPFVCIVLDYLAFRGILKDELLVRSLDRLR